KGIGKAVAKELVRRGAKVVLNGRNAEVLSRTAEELGRIVEDSRTADKGELMQIAADVSEPEAFEQAVQAIIQRYGRLDILILNAGLSSYGTVEKTSDATLHNVMKANTFAPFTGTRIALPHIRKTKGSIVFIYSLAGLHGIPHSSVYSMSKMALTALAQSLKTELSGQGIHIGILYIGFTQNDPEKMAVGPDGRIRPIQSRPGWVQQSPQKVARLILRNISRRRFRSTLSTMGKSMAFFSRYFPRLFQLSMRGMLKQAEKLTAD
ncbi:MAG: SDR family NAD(P)-dependent oxidoreductase, partial [Bacteroidales bacterium]|nr:SDR family NAD(P)-dependent oxidoreductase [Bacteroidales bacterium]